MSFTALANFNVPSSKSTAGDYTVQPYTSAKTTTGSVLAGTTVDSRFFFLGTVPDDTAYVVLLSTSLGTIDSQPVSSAALAARLTSTRAGNLDNLDTAVSGVKAKTDNLPTTPASQGDVNGARDTITAAIASNSDVR